MCSLICRRILPRRKWRRPQSSSCASCKLRRLATRLSMEGHPMNDGTTEAKEMAKQAVAAARGELVEISVDIHSHPELALNEHRAAKLLADHVEGHGFRVERGAYGIETAF